MNLKVRGTNRIQKREKVFHHREFLDPLLNYLVLIT